MRSVPWRRRASGSANQIFVESATGIGEGARTGLANIVTGVLFLVAIIASPLVTIVPFEAVAPALVVVGFLMVRQAVHIDLARLGSGYPRVYDHYFHAAVVLYR